MNLSQVLAARHSVRSFRPDPVPRDAVARAVGFAVQAPAPHHSRPWRFVTLESEAARRDLSVAMGERWRADLIGDGLASRRIDAIVRRSHELLSHTPLLVVCCADLARAHDYSDERRKLAEWSLFAHSLGAGLMAFMLGLTEEGIASCWISAPVFCRDVVRRHLELPAAVEPQALVLAGYASPEYPPRPRPAPDLGEFLLEKG